MGYLDFLSLRIGIDPGSQRLRIIKDDTVVFNEASKIVLDPKNGNTVAIGDSIQAETKGALLISCTYIISDYVGFEQLLRAAIKKGINPKPFLAYIIYYCIPSNSTQVDMRAYRDCAEHAGAKEVHLIFQCCCSAIGLNILLEKKTFILIDFSSSKFEIFIFENGQVISEGFIRLGTEKIFSLLKNHIFRKYTIELNQPEIDFLLHQLNNALMMEIEYNGKKINLIELRELVNSYFILVNDEIANTLHRVINLPSLKSVIENGAYFTGGGSSIEYLRKHITLDLEIEHHVSSAPDLDNINGLKLIMSDQKKYKNYIMAHKWN